MTKPLIWNVYGREPPETLTPVQKEYQMVLTILLTAYSTGRGLSWRNVYTA